jgi:hypothetical protein
MGKKRIARLNVASEGKRRYIIVPAGRAAALHAYLRGHHVIAAPPAPSYTGFDSIELAEFGDNTTIQDHLKGWFWRLKYLQIFAPAPLLGFHVFDAQGKWNDDPQESWWQKAASFPPLLGGTHVGRCGACQTPNAFTGSTLAKQQA